jgi:anti-sigma B factor antagonist
MPDPAPSNPTFPAVQVTPEIKELLGKISSRYERIRKTFSPLDKEHLYVGPVVVMEVPGKLSHAEGRAFLAKLQPILQSNHPRVVLDCSQLQHIDSAGVEILLHCLEDAMKRDGDVTLAALSPAAAVILQLMRVDRLFEVFETAEEAERSFHAIAPPHDPHTVNWYQEGEEVECVQPASPPDASKSHPMAHVALELYDPKTSRLDAKLVAKALDLPFSQLARALGVSAPQIQRDPSGRSLQEDLGKIAFCYSTLRRVLGTRKLALIWLNAPHPDLEARSPISLMKEHKTDMIVILLRNALAGQMS